MSVRSALLRRLPPSAVREKVITTLADTTARAAGVPPPRLSGPDVQRCEQYARFSGDLAAEAIARGTVGDLTAALRREAQAAGGRLRAMLGLATAVEGFDLASRLYAAIDIDLRVDAGGGILVTRCGMSRFYTPEICTVMSAMDEGVLAGLAGEGRLSFTRRITEGHPMCIARFIVGAP